MKLNLSCRLFLIIIVLFLVPYLTLFSWAYKKAETIIRDKAQSLERENLNQTKNDIESLCLNMIQASDYLISLNNYGVLYRESATKGYSYLKCWQDANEQIQNVNNSLLNSNADISVLSNDQLLYSTLPQQKFRFEDFFAEQVVPSVYFTNAQPELPPVLKAIKLSFPILESSRHFHRKAFIWSSPFLPAVFPVC